MRRAFRLAPEAAADLREIWRYIAADSVHAAKRFRLKLLDACRQLGMNPGMGHTREDLTDQALLFWPVGSYLIIYRADRGPIEIVAVAHGSRDIPAFLRRRLPS